MGATQCAALAHTSMTSGGALAPRQCGAGPGSDVAQNIGARHTSIMSTALCHSSAILSSCVTRRPYSV